ncbi:AraC family transcriptional regulator [Limibacter armeniacum]|uniref:helix-turn-helix domain-containing protein n=1 Tax=Limibacter armeniacum TaxID=466084 RepID=UPI002FE65208
MDNKNRIPTLNPVVFRDSYIRNNSDELLNNANVNHFFIHSFKDDPVKLSIPLPPHKKTVNDFVFVTNGSMIMSIGIESFHLKKNDFLFTPKNNISSTEYMSPNLEGYYCHFSDDFIMANPFVKMWQSNDFDNNLIGVSDNLNIILSLLSRIVELYKSDDESPNKEKVISFYVSTLMAEIFLISEKTAINGKKGNSTYLSFKNLVNKHLKERLSIKDYASLLHVSPNHLNKKIKNETGKAATEIINELTILEAKVLLLQSKRTVSEISVELGFNDVSYFSRFFKNKTQYSPLEYRNMIDMS